MIKTILKKTLYLLLILIGLLVLAYWAFTSFYPSFGGEVSEERQMEYQRSKQFREGQFHNVADVPKKMSFPQTMKLAYNYFTTKVVNGRPKADLQVHKLDSLNLVQYVGEARMVWFGHSSFLLQTEGKTILIDPMFGAVAAPHPWLGSNRFNKEFPLELAKMPRIDAVIFSHDHYDHLDYETILNIKDKTHHFFVPLGVGVHLEAWGIAPEKITELDWWEETTFDNLTLACTPAQHFSGRKLSNNQSTLWSSWVIQSEQESIFFSGDSGFSPHFTEIGEKYGPFDLALLECGQYNTMWPDIHMLPEETAQAGIDVQAKKFMPMHWGGFQLALHPWKDPINRVEKKAKELKINMIAPEIGQVILVKDTLPSYRPWWRNL